MMGQCVRGQPEEPEADIISIWPLLFVLFFALVGVVAMTCVLVQQGWKQWRRCRVCRSRQMPTTAVQKSGPETVVGDTAVGSTAIIHCSSRNSSSNKEAAQLAARRGRDMSAIWARTEDQKWTALNSVCVTCGKQLDELAVSCDNCHRRMHSWTTCGRTCRCPHTMCLQCFHRHRCL